MIKTKQIKTAKATILVIGGLPEDTSYVTIIIGDLFYAKEDGDWGLVAEHDMPKGKWELIGFLKDISDTDAIQVVDIWGATWDGKKYSYINYITKWYCEDPKESLHSLIEANCKLKNKYGEKPKSLDEYVRKSEDSNGLSYIDPYQMNLYARYVQEYNLEQENIFYNPFLLRKVNA